MSWTEERVERLKEMWGDGCSYSQIAADLGGMTRGAISAKIDRLGLSNRRKKKHRPKKLRKPGPSLANYNPVADRHSLPDNRLSALRAQYEDACEATDLAPELSTTAVTFAELRDLHCKWPLGTPTTLEFRFCGGPRVSGLPYCGPHCRMAYARPAERERGKKAM